MVDYSNLILRNSGTESKRGTEEVQAIRRTAWEDEELESDSQISL